MYPSSYPPKCSANQHPPSLERSWIQRLFPPKRKVVVSIEERALLRTGGSKVVLDSRTAVNDHHRYHETATSTTPSSRRPQSPAFMFHSPPHMTHPPQATRSSFFSSLSSRLVSALIVAYAVLSVVYMVSVDPAQISDRSASVPFSPSSTTFLSRDGKRTTKRFNVPRFNHTQATRTSTERQQDAVVESKRQQASPFKEHLQSDISVPHPPIPRILIFTHSVNLLQIAVNETAMETVDGESKVLAANVQKSIQRHPNVQVRFLTNSDCEDAIVRVYENREDMRNKSQRLLYFFRKETQGMFKGDLCRGVALVETGGMYLDVDLGVRMDLFRALQNSTTFATVRVHKHSHNVGSFFQAFMATTPRHPILERYVDLFLDYYEGKLPQYKGKPLGVVLLRHAFDQVLSEIPALNSTVELWQEVQYDMKLKHTLLKHVPPPTWGTRRACKFIVVAPFASRHAGSGGQVVVPLYSRIANSRMCPA